MRIPFIIFLATALAQAKLLEDDMKSGGLQDSLQAKNVTLPEKGTGKTSKGTLKEYKDHAEMQAATEEPKDATPAPPSPKLVTNEAKEVDKGRNETATMEPDNPLVPTPQKLDPVEDVELSDDDAEDIKVPSTKKPIKGRKGVKYQQSVSPRKEAPPESNKPSVVPRKDADPTQLKTSDVTSTITTTTTLPTADTKAEIGETPNKSMATNLNMPPVTEKKKPFVPKLTEATMNFSSVEKDTDVVITSPSISSTTTIPSYDIPRYGEPARPPTSIPTTTTERSNSTHFKPTAATDSISQSAEDNVSYTPAVIGLVLLIVIIVTIIVVGYRRLQDVWMRRHYARMDFLIDGMYDV